MKQKRGQFFLIAAVVIIVITVSIMTISNYTQSTDKTNINDLGDEMQIESTKVLDYWASEQKEDAELDKLIETFIDNYVNSLDNNKNIYFIFGNSSQVHFRGYQLDGISECVCIELNNEIKDANSCSQTKELRPGACIPATLSTRFNGITQNFTVADNNIRWVIASIGDEDYKTQIKPGENFYFIMTETEMGEKHIVKSAD